jgi:hypothetical protein
VVRCDRRNPDGGTFSENAMLAVLDRLSYGHVTVHGFRSTFATWAEKSTDYPDGVREAALAHKYRSETTAAYQRGQKLEKRRALMKDCAQFLRRIKSDLVFAKSVERTGDEGCLRSGRDFSASHSFMRTLARTRHDRERKPCRLHPPWRAGQLSAGDSLHSFSSRRDQPIRRPMARVLFGSEIAVPWTWS